MLEMIDALLGREQPRNDALWHKWATFMPVRTVDGRWAFLWGQLWRRRTAQGWEYRLDEETDDEWLDNQW